MKLNKIASAALMCAAIMSYPAVAGNGTRVGSYDFTYASAGEARAQPVQVFDNGINTYFQFRAGTVIPAIFGQVGGNLTLLIPVQEGPYVRVEGVFGQFTLQIGAARAEVIHAGATRMDAPEIKIAPPSGMVTPYMGGAVPSDAKLLASVKTQAAPTLIDDKREHYSYATPIKGDKVSWDEVETLVQDNAVWFVAGRTTLGPVGRKTVKSIASRAPRGARFVVVGQYDETMGEKMEEGRAAALRDELVANGVPLSSITVKYGQKGTTQNKLWSSLIQIESDAKTAMIRGNRPSENTAVVDNVQSLVKKGVLSYDQGQAILRRSNVAAVEPQGEFQMKASDKTLQGMIRRWSEAAGYRLVWEATEAADPKISGDAVIKAPSIVQALDKVMADIKAKGYALDLTIYSNKVIRITPAKPAQAERSPASDRAVEPIPSSARRT